MYVLKRYLWPSNWIFRPGRDRDNIVFLHQNMVIRVVGQLDPEHLYVLEVFDILQKVAYLINFDTIDEAYEGTAKTLADQGDRYDTTGESTGMTIEQKKRLVQILDDLTVGKQFPKTYAPLWGQVVRVAANLDLFEPGE